MKMKEINTNIFRRVSKASFLTSPASKTRVSFPSPLLRLMISEAKFDTKEICVTRTNLLSMYLQPQSRNKHFPFLLHTLSAVAMV